ncbi:ribosomal-protein-alanine N-acetyltransferase [Sphingomonas sp. YR710]|uniref:GNAT family N-acetyltransferase n=1 Tax=Sphingomonas sp. YR710 TaxID=1882773 RepID=UPI0008830720|nr:GNAT family N-acetyltransferase [Sphingomonas sp. YR710]SDD43872.1 ribosomal-protein-alanine N-acetyltransferase [Sphingomonas sp. YR710]
MTDRIDIREAGAEALDEMMLTMNDAFDPGFGEAWTASQSLSMLSLPGVWLSLARYDGEAAGFALNRIAVDEVELLLLAVRPAHRRLGIGLRLIEQTSRIAREQQASKIHLEVRHNNPALQLYVNAGFMLIGRRSGYYRGRDGAVYDALTLSCAL